MRDWIRRLILGNPQEPQHPELDERERRVEEDLARASHTTPNHVRERVHRRAITLEAQSIRRQRQ